MARLPGVRNNHPEQLRHLNHERTSFGMLDRHKLAEIPR